MSTSGFNVVGYRIVIDTSSVNVINFTNRRFMSCILHYKNI